MNVRERRVRRARERLPVRRACVCFHSALARRSPRLGEGCDVRVGWEGAAGGACHVTWTVSAGKEGQSGEPSRCSCGGCSGGLSGGEVGPRAPAPGQPQGPLRGLRRDSQGGGGGCGSGNGDLGQTEPAVHVGRRPSPARSPRRAGGRRIWRFAPSGSGGARTAGEARWELGRANPSGGRTPASRSPGSGTAGGEATRLFGQPVSRAPVCASRYPRKGSAQARLSLLEARSGIRRVQVPSADPALQGPGLRGLSEPAARPDREL